MIAKCCSTGQPHNHAIWFKIPHEFVDTGDETHENQQRQRRQAESYHIEYFGALQRLIIAMMSEGKEEEGNFGEAKGEHASEDQGWE